MTDDSKREQSDAKNRDEADLVEDLEIKDAEEAEAIRGGTGPVTSKQAYKY
jgi:hypothetical protein